MSKIYFRYGAMNSGKSTVLIQVAHNYEEKGGKILVIKPSVDKKGDDKIVSRLGVERTVDVLLSPKEKLIDCASLDKVDCILVDESQFLTREQVRELWIISKQLDIPVICYGLKVNFRGELFEGSKALFEVADEYEELITICDCKKKARFNARLENGEYVTEGKEVAIEGIDASYNSLCGKCYMEKVLKIGSYFLNSKKGKE